MQNSTPPATEAVAIRPDSAKRRALLIGIDDYQPPEPALTGCVNDVELMRDVLVSHFHFPEENIAVVTNAGATRAAILGALERLLSETRHDDNVVIHYAGHGSQVTDREGDEPNGLDSTWHPVDSSAWDAKARVWIGENRDITDDELAIWIARFAAVTQYLTVVVDACHSGGISRDATEERSRGTRADNRPIEQLPESPLGPLPLATERSASGWGAPARSYVLIAGCRSEERSMELDPSAEHGRAKSHGALTWHLTQNLLEAEARTTYADVFELTASRVTREKPGQHPQIEGWVDRTVFGITDLPVATYRLITSRNELGEVTLRGGAAHMMTVGSRFAIYPPGAKEFSGAAATPIGEVIVTAVMSVTSRAQIVEGSESTPFAIGEMCRAVETQHVFGNSRCDVLCEGGEPEVALLRRMLDASGTANLTQERSAAAIVVTLQDGVWCVATPGGRRLAPLVPAGSEALVVSNVETIVRWMRLRALRNHDAASRLSTQPPLMLELMKWRDEAWSPASLEAGGTSIDYDANEKIAFRVTKTDPGDLFLTLFDLDPTGAISRLWPNTTADALTGSKSFLVAPGPGEAPWQIAFPDSEAMATLCSRDERYEYVEETCLVIVTQQRADFREYEQAGTRRSVYDGRGPDRGMRMRAPALDDDWTVMQQTYRVRRRLPA